ncbi:MAG: hypothetical protein HZA24_10120 [Nitrospirae bacterium]|nr:hypothetical protein [Nitrospirota bacterium]
MEIVVISVAALALFLAALHGWGRLVARAAGQTPPDSWAFTALIGMVTWGAIGGPLNVFGLARGPALDAMIVLGLLPTAWFLFGAARGVPGVTHIVRACLGPNRNRLIDWLPRLIVWSATLHAIATLLPTDRFNFVDDLQKYAPQPYQMLAAGTLGGNPFDNLGLHSLGLQAYFQAFLLNHAPYVYVNGFDTVLCLLLAGLMLDDLGRRAGVGVVVRCLAVVTLVWINPQYVNTSSVYSSTVCMVGMAYAAVMLGEALAAGAIRATAAWAVLLGATGAILTALKITMTPYALAFIVLFLAAGLARREQWRGTALASAGALLGGAAVLQPWLFTYPHSYVTLLLGNLGRAREKISQASAANNLFEQAAPAKHAHAEGILGKLRLLFSSDTTYFGHHFLEYGIIAVAALALALLALRALLSRRRAGNGAYLAVAVAAGISGALYFLAIPYVFPVPHKGFRYLAPLLVVLLPLCALSYLGGVARPGLGVADSRRHTLRSTAVVALLALVTAMFTERYVARVVQLNHHRSMYSNPTPEWVTAYLHKLFSPNTRAAIRGVQARTRPGEGILARISMPVHLDFERNPIHTIPDPGYSLLWLKVSVDQGPEELLRTLRETGIGYVLWEYNGVGVFSNTRLPENPERVFGDVPQWQRVAGFNRQLVTLARTHQVLFDNGRVMLIRLTPPA